MAKRPLVQVQGTPWQEETVEETYPLLASIAAGRNRPWEIGDWEIGCCPRSPSRGLELAEKKDRCPCSGRAPISNPSAISINPRVENI